MSGTKPVSTEPIESGTGRSWENWLKWLEENGARELSHKEIARRVKEKGQTTGWWACRGRQGSPRERDGEMAPLRRHAGGRHPGNRQHQ